MTTPPQTRAGLPARTFTDADDLDWDEATQTVRSDDGSRLSIWEIDDCPVCGGTIHRSYAEGPGERDVLFCLNALGFEPTCNVSADRPAEPDSLPAPGAAEPADDRYVTPPSVLRAVVDPACGAGGFLATNPPFAVANDVATKANGAPGGADGEAARVGADRLRGCER